ncbi:SPOR domain-containing protein [Roseobacter ponti]|uniref:SPOR domain-containing protein n=1 Tax=Roseobacter ponti TaxID=1891787 RepID=A0A858STF3_9RHOB|nr:SPOR domain-containing protein [Roseobacter ponti]QJF51984.1 SPOR domain-containing protein [Roseobacter ponti]
MNSKRSSRISRCGRGVAAGFAALLTLAACDETGSFSLGGTPSATGSAGGSVSRTTGKDVESPEVFYALEKALWDGRPSLGGVWVAYPNVETPERVIIRNKENGKFVIGALFRRISNQPGPQLQLSSDAAAAIDVLAGAPVDLEVVALRKEVIVEEPPEEEVPEETTEETPDEGSEDGSAATASAAPATAATAAGDPVVAAAETAIAAPEKETATAVPSTDIVASTLPVSTLSKPFLQAATVSSQKNADRAVSDLGKAGLNASFKSESDGDSTLWRILVGPAASEAERDTMLATLKEAGFTDAYAVSK